MRGLTRLLLAALLLAACARMAAPPGGPIRRVPPRLVGVFPDTGTTPCDLRAPAEFRFDEVTSDAGNPNFGYGDGTLERLIMLSPDTAVPAVHWHRNRITVEPRAGWRPHTAYRIELLPGLLDLHQNVTKSGGVIAFATCGTRPTRVLSGRAIDWLGQREVPNALIEAFHLPDSARYRALADSTGRFTIDGLPDGAYLVVATVDQNRDHRRQPNEAWDSVRVAATQDTVGEIWTFPRDTTPPRIQDITRIDSQSIAVRYSKPIDPTLRIDPLSVRVGLLPDTVSIGVLDAYPKAYADSIHKPVPVPRTPKEDSTFRRDSVKRDSLAKANPPPRRAANARPVPVPDLPREKRPALGDVIVIRTRGQVRLDQSYFVELRGVRAPGGTAGPAFGKTLLKDLAKLRADSLSRIKAKADSLKADSLKKAKGDSAAKVIKPW